MTGVKKVGELRKKRKRERETQTDRQTHSHTHTHIQQQITQKALMKNESKKATGPCPALPLAASRRSPPDGPFCNPPDPKDARGHRDLSKSPRAAFPGAHVPGSQAAPRSERWTAQSSSASQAARGRA